MSKRGVPAATVLQVTLSAIWIGTSLRPSPIHAEEQPSIASQIDVLKRAKTDIQRLQDNTSRQANATVSVACHVNNPWLAETTSDKTSSSMKSWSSSKTVRWKTCEKRPRMKTVRPSVKQTLSK